MHEPAWLHGLVVLYDFAIQPVPIKPEPCSSLIFYPKIITRRHRFLRTPPFHGDAFRAFRANDGVRRATPFEMFWWLVRDFRKQHLDRLRPLEQPQRPQRRLAFGTRR